MMASCSEQLFGFENHHDAVGTPELGLHLKFPARSISAQPLKPKKPRLSRKARAGAKSLYIKIG